VFHGRVVLRCLVTTRATEPSGQFPFRPAGDHPGLHTRLKNVTATLGKALAVAVAHRGGELRKQGVQLRVSSKRAPGTRKMPDAAISFLLRLVVSTACWRIVRSNALAPSRVKEIR
jgi:hypothetical protein